MTCVARLHASLNLTDPYKRVSRCNPWSSITCKSKSQLLHLVSIIMTEQQTKQLEQVMCQLADIVREVDDIELTSAFDEIIIYMSNNS